jgi:hypothetical protein
VVGGFRPRDLAMGHSKLSDEPARRAWRVPTNFKCWLRGRDEPINAMVLLRMFCVLLSVRLWSNPPRGRVVSILSRHRALSPAITLHSVARVQRLIQCQQQFLPFQQPRSCRSLASLIMASCATVWPHGPKDHAALRNVALPKSVTGHQRLIC